MGKYTFREVMVRWVRGFGPGRHLVRFATGYLSRKLEFSMEKYKLSKIWVRWVRVRWVRVRGLGGSAQAGLGSQLGRPTLRYSSKREP